MSRASDLAKRVVNTQFDVQIYDDLRALTPEECDEFDTLVFPCELCARWCDMEEAQGAPGSFVCKDCADLIPG